MPRRRTAWTGRGSGSGVLRHMLQVSAAAALVLGLGAGLAACSRSTTGVEKRLSAEAVPQQGGGIDPRTGTSASPRIFTDGQSIPKGGGAYKLGTPYKVSGRWYVPREEPDYDRTGTASWYGADFHGRKTANGEIFDMGALTAAHPTLPIPSYVYVTYLETGRTVLVRVNDRGPYAHDRIIDLSRQTARVLGLEGRGVGQVRVQYAGRAPLNGDDQRERQFLAAQPWSRGQWYASAGAGAMVQRDPQPMRPVPREDVRPMAPPSGSATPDGAWSPLAHREARAAPLPRRP